VRYHPHTEPDIARLLKAAGAESLEGLFSSIPKPLQLHRPLQLPPPLDERALLDYFGGLAGKNRTSPAPFLGAGAYPHHVPVAVDQLLLRSEFYTAYTPYQPEMAQGTLQAIFEFQTFVCLLTGLEIANASLYDGATACAEAALLALRLKKDRKSIVMSGALHPSYRAVIRTYLKTTGTEVREIPYDAETGRTDPAALKRAITSDTALVLLGSPNFFGVVEEVRVAGDLAHDAGALLGVAISEALSLGVLASPGELGADVAVGEMQSFGNTMNFGGPGLGFLATREAFLRQIPGRICGETVDNRGQRAFVLTLSTREQHIRREHATSNICTNNGLNALAATMHLAILGKRGLHELALLNWRRAKYARERMGHAARFSGPTFNEFVVRVKPGAYQRAHDAGMIPGLELGTYDPALRDCLLLCVTELHDKHQIDLLADALRSDGK
jgi:glycine dehydrogenase subunit 1